MNSEIFGRDAEQAAAMAFLDAVEQGPAAFVIEGPPGIGKTTLWRWAVDEGAARGYRVLSAGPSQAEAKLSFAGLADLAARVFDEIGDTLPGPQRRAMDVALLRADPGEEGLDQRAAAMALLSLIRELAAGGPVLVAVEDTQWLDPSTAASLTFVSRRLEGLPVGVLISARPGPPIPIDPSLLTEPTLELGPLSLAALHHLIDARLGGRPSRPVLVAIERASGGNPLYALELARSLIRDGVPAPGTPLQVPETLAALVEERIAALSADSRHALLAAAALAAPTVELVAGALPELSGEDVLGPAVKATIIEVDATGRIRFTHPLLASGAYALATPEDRRAMHSALAETLGESEERARHLALAAEGPDEGVAAALEAAAAAARARGAHEAAADLAELAVSLTPAGEAEGRRRRTLRLAEARFGAQDPIGAVATLEAAVDSPPPGPGRAELLWRLGQFYRYSGGLQLSADTLARARDEAGEDDALRAAILMDLGISMNNLADTAGSYEALRAAAELAEGVGDEDALAQALAAFPLVQMMLGQPYDASVLERAMSLAQRGAGRRLNSTVESYPRYTLAFFFRNIDDQDTSRRLLEEELRLALERGDEASLPTLLWGLVEGECWSGNLASAREHARRALEASRYSDTATIRCMGLYATALVGAYEGRFEDARAASDAAMAIALEGSVMLLFGMLYSVLGFCDVSESNWAGARERLDPMLQMVGAMNVAEPSLMRFLPDAVEALIRLGQVDEAEAQLIRYETRALEADRASARAAAARCRALLQASGGDLDEATTTVTLALAQHDRISMPLERARTLLVGGEIHRRAKRKALAREQLQEAKEVFTQVRARAWLARADEEIARLGIRASAPEGLTETERRAAGLVGAGKTNREVAEALFVSPKSVEGILTRVYRKLGVRSRTELAARLAGGGPNEDDAPPADLPSCSMERGIPLSSTSVEVSG